MFGLYTIRKVLEVSCVLKKCFKLSIKNASFLSAAKTSLDRRYMIVDIGNYEDDLKIKEFKYPLVWLRDNCQCSNCFHAQSKSRIIDWTKFKFENAQPKSILVCYNFFPFFFLIHENICNKTKKIVFLCMISFIYIIQCRLTKIWK